jgi:hypothetical protein
MAHRTFPINKGVSSAEIPQALQVSTPAGMPPADTSEGYTMESFLALFNIDKRVSSSAKIFQARQDSTPAGVPLLPGIPVGSFSRKDISATIDARYPDLDSQIAEVDASLADPGATPCPCDAIDDDDEEDDDDDDDDDDDSDSNEENEMVEEDADNLGSDSRGQSKHVRIGFVSAEAMKARVFAQTVDAFAQSAHMHCSKGCTDKRCLTIARACDIAAVRIKFWGSIGTVAPKNYARRVKIIELLRSATKSDTCLRFTLA